ncbi:METTL21A [Bugula neritina]|uniref:METTL21A n=1 Tax=Bugula neritina TaxID=10212 RepID=A0A7J7K167_BUGNE|nr:METTL21A [Bugula neritina]
MMWFRRQATVNAFTATSSPSPTSAVAFDQENNLTRTHLIQKTSLRGGTTALVAGVVWDAAVVLCEYIVANPTLFLNKKVLELGSGTGLSGICAYMEGSRVTLTDRPIHLMYSRRMLN